MRNFTTTCRTMDTTASKPAAYLWALVRGISPEGHQVESLASLGQKGPPGS
jgi:hypothetical protein